MADLVTAAEYKAYAVMSETTYDTAIGVWIAIASATLRRYCDRHMTTGFESATYTEKYDGTGHDSIQLKEWPITSITSVTEYDDAGNTTTIASTDYRTNLTTGRLFRLGASAVRFGTDSFGYVADPQFGVSPCWTAGVQNFQVVYVAAGMVTVDLKWAAYQLVDWMFGSAGGNPIMQSESLGGYTYTRLANSQDAQAVAVRAILAPFKTGGLVL